MLLRLFLVLLSAALLVRPGWAGDGAVALQTADTSCRTTTTPPPRFVDCGNGTVTDNKTGLVWLKNADCIVAVDWYTAMEFVAGLGDWPGRVARGDCFLSDGSSPGEWRLPSAWEWQRMVADAVELGCVFGTFGGPSITSDSGESCWQEGPGNSFSGVRSSIYWSSTTDAYGTEFAWGVNMNNGDVSFDLKSNSHRVWPVRGGQ